MPMLSSGDELPVQSAAAPVTVESRDVVRADIKEAGESDVPF